MKRRVVLGALGVALLALAAGGVGLRGRARHAHPSGPPRVVVLARSAMSGSSVMVDDTSAYYLGADSSLRAVPKAGGESRVVARLEGPTYGAAILGTDASDVYFAFADARGPGVARVKRVVKGGGTPVDVPGPCAALALLDGDAIVCATGNLEVSRVDARTGAVLWTARLGIAGESPNGVAHLARWGDAIYVATEAQARGASMRIFTLRRSDGQATQVYESGYASTLPIAADATGLYAGEPTDPEVNVWSVVRHPGPPFAARQILANVSADALALTPSNVVWRARTSHDVAMAPKDGGPAVILVQGARDTPDHYAGHLGDLAADATSVYFVDQWDVVIRVDGLD